MPPASVTLVTPFGMTEDPTPEQIREAIAGASCLADSFAQLKRPDGSFALVSRLVLEYGREGRQFRLDVGRYAEEVFARLARGEAPEGTLPWREVTEELEEGLGARWASLWNLLILGAVVAGILGLGWYLLTRTPGL